MDFDCHQHLDVGTDLGQYVARLGQHKLRAGVSSCGPCFGQPGNAAVEKALKRYPDLIVGFGYIELLELKN